MDKFQGHAMRLEAVVPTGHNVYDLPAHHHHTTRTHATRYRETLEKQYLILYKHLNEIKEKNAKNNRENDTGKPSSHAVTSMSDVE